MRIAETGEGDTESGGEVRIAETGERDTESVGEDPRTLGRSGQLGVVFTRSDWLASKYILN